MLMPGRRSMESAVRIMQNAGEHRKLSGGRKGRGFLFESDHRMAGKTTRRVLAFGDQRRWYVRLGDDLNSTED